MKHVVGTLKNILLLTVSILIAFVAVEIALRVLRPDKGGELISITFSKNFVKNDSRFGFIGIPFAEGSCYNCETRVPYKLNSKGFRDREHAVIKGPGQYRVMVLGDSFAWGVGVGKDAVFTHLLEEKDKRLDVMNIATPGWSTVSEYFYLENEGLKYKPDMAVVVFFVENDCIGNGDYQRHGWRDIGSGPSVEKKKYKLFSIKYIQDHSRIFRLWKRKRRDLKVEWGLTPILTEYNDGSADWKATTEWIDKFKNLADKNGVELVFVIAPSRSQFFLRRDAEKPQEMLKRHFEKRDIKYLDLYPVFSSLKKARRADWGYFKYDGHWDAFGHMVVARELLRFIHLFEQ